ncbi:MAG TPA: MATE family efflux transporter [Leptolyngbyaceae cyanobacterium M33_DOE_097]|uniref:Probable multidrug resistance protein NorM n=1 Tax=Oscillatoriales cyanobacterium SpSt-418 TaxID=2282169 RepID=A0A7C3PG65_9CYAN|nr:MATE family efflux transporter [Leptolyngbyaceae cyanobacterium M33_DOE_097]
MVYLTLSKPIQTEIRAFIRLTVPLAAAQVAQAATGFVDTVMMGWLGQETLAAGGLAAATFSTLLVSGVGIVTGISPLIAESHGAGNFHRIRQLTCQGFWLVVLVSLPVMVLLAQMGSVLTLLGQKPEIAVIAKPYLDVMIWAYLPALTFTLLKSVVSSLSHPQPIMGIVVTGTCFNAIGNYVLGFGKLGFPTLGLTGLALSTMVTHWGMAIALLLYMLWHRKLKDYRLFAELRQFHPKILRELMAIGLPIGVAFTLEVGLFTTTTYLMGVLGTEVLAAHQIVFQTIVVVFMVPLGLSFANTIRVGQWIGQGDREAAKRAAYVGMVLGGLFMTLMAIALSLSPKLIIGLYLNVNDPRNAAVVSLAASMLIVAAFAQILDGVQTSAAGALRGLKDTRVPMLLSFIAFWGVGLASGYLIGFRLGLGGVGLWLGQSLGIAAAAGVFIRRFRYLIRPVKP